MYHTFITLFKLKNTYRVNSFIYSLKQIPLIKKILPNKLYKSKFLKGLGNFFSIMTEITTTFLGKFLYLLIMIYFALELYKTNPSNTFIHLFVFLTITGGILNTFLFNPTKDKYYAMIIMKMNTKKYTISNYIYNIIKTYIGFIPFVLIFGLLSGISYETCLLLPIFVIMIKMIYNYYFLLLFKKNGMIKNENAPKKLEWVVVGILLLIAYLVPFTGYIINEDIFYILLLISIVVGIYSIIKIFKFDDYQTIYKKILNERNVYIVQSDVNAEMLKENVQKQIKFDSKSTSNKDGYAFFHELFIKRHRKILTDAIKKQSIVIIIIFVLSAVALMIYPGAKKEVNDIILTYLPYFVFVMYMLNRGTSVTQAMFINCDHSMLTYQFYRTPKVLLGVFKERLKTLIKLNLIPGFLIAIILPALLLITGGTANPLNYFILFVSIISMSVFFSVHYLIMYYLLQPYNINTEMKSSTYQIIQTITYIVCYQLIGLKMPTIIFGGIMIIFSVLYSSISLLMVYKIAPKTFKIRM